MKFIALDFETANPYRYSVCAMGVAIVDGKTILRRQSWLIRPPVLEFDDFNIEIHGITEEDVENEPEFDKRWEEFKPLLEGNLIVAHNASFDMSVLRHVLDRYGIPYPKLDYLCTRVIAHRLWPKLVNYTLPIVSEHLGIHFTHHKAEEDASASAQILLRACQEKNIFESQQLAESLNIKIGNLFEGGYNPCGFKAKPLRLSEITSTKESFDPEHVFFGKNVVFTGTLQSMVRRDAIQKVVDCGGACSSSVLAKTNYLIMGEQDFWKLRGKKKSSKIRKAEQLVSDGANLELIPESEFLQLLDP